jgi:hypothetical protein
VPLPPCIRCGRTNPRKMIGLMTLWFGPFVDMRPDHGYFYLCPDCYRERIKPHLDQVQNRLAELHPLAHHLGLHPRPEDEAAEMEEGSAERDDGVDGFGRSPRTGGEGVGRRGSIVAAGGGGNPGS